MNTERVCSLTCSSKKPKSIIMKQNFPFFTVCTWKQEHLALQPKLAAALLSISTWQTETNGDWLPQVGPRNEECPHQQKPHRSISKCGNTALHQAGHHKRNLLCRLHFFLSVCFFLFGQRTCGAFAKWCVRHPETSGRVENTSQI